MKVLRTPDERFENLVDFPYEPHYLEVGDGLAAGWSGTSADRFENEVPGAKGQQHVTIANARHYVQDDAAEELARVVVDFIRST